MKRIYSQGQNQGANLKDERLEPPPSCAAVPRREPLAPLSDWVELMQALGSLEDRGRLAGPPDIARALKRRRRH